MEHALQSASLAEKEDAEESLVVATLLHDVWLQECLPLTYAASKTRSVSPEAVAACKGLGFGFEDELVS